MRQVVRKRRSHTLLCRLMHCEQPYTEVCVRLDWCQFLPHRIKKKKKKVKRKSSSWSSRAQAKIGLYPVDISTEQRLVYQSTAPRGLGGLASPNAMRIMTTPGSGLWQKTTGGHQKHTWPTFIKVACNCPWQRYSKCVSTSVKKERFLHRRPQLCQPQTYYIILLLAFRDFCISCCDSKSHRSFVLWVRAGNASGVSSPQEANVRFSPPRSNQNQPFGFDSDSVNTSVN